MPKIQWVAGFTPNLPTMTVHIDRSIFGMKAENQD
jgi:hypothetical protein